MWKWLSHPIWLYCYRFESCPDYKKKSLLFGFPIPGCYINNMKKIKVMKTEFVEAYINVLVEAYGENVFKAIKEVVEDGSSKSPKNMEELKEYARKDILWNFSYSKDKEITEKFCREVAEPYTDMLGSNKFLLDKSKGSLECKLLVKGYCCNLRCRPLRADLAVPPRPP